jgi:hypothetical protein
VTKTKKKFILSLRPGNKERKKGGSIKSVKIRVEFSTKRNFQLNHQKPKEKKQLKAESFLLTSFQEKKIPKCCLFFPKLREQSGASSSSCFSQKLFSFFCFWNKPCFFNQVRFGV